MKKQKFCEHKYKPIKITKETWKDITPTSWYATPHCDKHETFYLYCEKCGDIVKRKKKEK